MGLFAAYVCIRFGSRLHGVPFATRGKGTTASFKWVDDLSRLQEVFGTIETSVGPKVCACRRGLGFFREWLGQDVGEKSRQQTATEAFVGATVALKEW